MGKLVVKFVLKKCGFGQERKTLLSELSALFTYVALDLPQLWALFALVTDTNQHIV